MRWFRSRTGKIVPARAEHAEASENPGGWVYRIGGGHDPDGAIPPEAIMGAWKVDGKGKIIGDFVPNPNFRS